MITASSNYLWTQPATDLTITANDSDTYSIASNIYSDVGTTTVIHVDDNKTSWYEKIPDSSSEYTSSSSGYGPLTWKPTKIEGTLNVWGTSGTINISVPATVIINGSDKYVISRSPKDRLKEILRSRRMPLITTRRQESFHPAKPIGHTKDIRELRARETLRRVIGDQKYRGFLKNGFITVRAKSGLIYQIFSGHGVTAVYDMGEMVERLCVVLNDNFPPTDQLIMRYLLILNDEADFRSHANKHSLFRRNPLPPAKIVDDRPLTEIYKELKAA
jgi:hypothetical protein